MEACARQKSMVLAIDNCRIENVAEFVPSMRPSRSAEKLEPEALDHLEEALLVSSEKRCIERKRGKPKARGW